jgi:uncharacterized membrane-anchored protein
VDAFRGRYISLEFEVEAQQISPPPNARYGQTVFVTLRSDGEGFAVIDQVLPNPPEDDAFLEAPLHGTVVSLPFDVYWVNEREAPAAEAAYRAQSTGEKRNAFVTVRVFKGNAVLEQLYLDGVPLGEYLRANPQL